MKFLNIIRAFAASFIFLGVSGAPNITPVKRALATVYTNCKVANTAALTFDDGPWQYHKQISILLKNAGAKGTFFVNGNNYACIYDPAQVLDLKASFAAGHQIASHTWHHKHLTTLSRDEIDDEMWRVEKAMMDILGVSPAMMRPPFGSYNNLVREVASERGQSLILWDLDNGDSVGKTPSQSKSLYSKSATSKANNILTLNHETYYSTVNEVLPYALAKFKDAGYRMVTVAECLGVPAYRSQKAPGTRNSSWKC